MATKRFNTSNVYARRYLESLGFNHIYFQRHGLFKDVYSGSDHENYKQTDLWGLYDGFAWHGKHLIFFQVKTNHFMSKLELDACRKFAVKQPHYSIQIRVKYYKKAIERKHWISEHKQILPLGLVLELKNKKE
ncbi:MAG: hypothetical protein K8823_1546 [Cenarchaeum symbiont of Oopsacas minuta]|nr:hypothetical protein [Cenarchaeum symbiont of Oopsacas minuta]